MDAMVQAPVQAPGAPPLSPRNPVVRSFPQSPADFVLHP